MLSQTAKEIANITVLNSMRLWLAKISVVQLGLILLHCLLSQLMQKKLIWLISLISQVSTHQCSDSNMFVVKQIIHIICTVHTLISMFYNMVIIYHLPSKIRVMFFVFLSNWSHACFSKQEIFSRGNIMISIVFPACTTIMFIWSTSLMWMGVKVVWRKLSVLGV